MKMISFKFAFVGFILFIGGVQSIVFNTDNNYFDFFEKINNSECAVLIENDQDSKDWFERIKNRLNYGEILKFDYPENFSISLDKSYEILILITNHDIDEEIFLEIFNRNMKVFGVSTSRHDNSKSSSNLKKLSLLTDGYFLDVHNPERVKYKKISDIIGTPESAMVASPSGETIDLLDRKNLVSNVYFVELKPNESGVWSVSSDAKKRGVISAIIEDARPAKTRARFERMAKLENALPPISIEVAEGSDLTWVVKQQSKISFEVTNNLRQLVKMNFDCRGRIQQSENIEPKSLTMQANQTTTVTVTMYPSSFTEQYDNITFIVYGSSTIQKKLIMISSDQMPNDSEDPHVWYTLTSDCLEISECQSGSWAVDVTAQDSETGLLRLTSQPKGIYFDSENFISGTKDEVTGHYGASCCNSKLEITAVDLVGNKRVVEVDAYSSATLSAGIVSSIVLGVIILIVIIIVIVYFVVKKKQKGSLDLPSYRGPSSTRSAI